MKFIKIIFAVVLFGSLTSCEQVIELPLSDEADSKIVINGLVSDLPGPYYVDITKSRNFFSNDEPDVVIGATVWITENGELVDTLLEVRPGVYETQKITGEPGSSYVLDVWSNGEHYQAEETMPSHVVLSGVRFDPLEIEDQDELCDDKGDCRPLYNILLSAKEPQHEVNYYLWRFYENGDLVVDPEEIIYADDQFVSGSDIVDLPLDIYVREGDTIRMEMLSLTKEHWEYWWGVDEQINFAGGPTGSPPDNVSTNLSNGALGYFGVSAISSNEGIVGSGFE